SIEVATDLLRADKADFVVAGGFDDLGREGARGFAEMQATFGAADIARKGLEANEASRPCDARRGGFVEAQGGGTALLCRADLALEMGLPIFGLVVGAWSCADGLQRSVPAPGPGVLSIGAGGPDSPLGQRLSALGLAADDIGVISIHGTSTDANDINETKLHAELAKALGRTDGNPLPIIAQKALTGHAKGGAAAWQLNGLLQALNDGVIPPMRNLDEIDPRLTARAPLVFPDRQVTMGAGQLKAGMLTSLGFGHVGAAVCVAHGDTLLGQLPAEDLSAYGEKRHARWLARLNAEYEVLLDQAPYFEGRSQKPIDDEGEMALLLDPSGRIEHR
ncbi:MAG: beta-ketoacyl synthase, partial [Myxococcota bacterium]|nr:beta-ketoacyl synthase [Myxococcota bacterium]